MQRYHEISLPDVYTAFWTNEALQCKALLSDTALQGYTEDQISFSLTHWRGHLVLFWSSNILLAFYVTSRLLLTSYWLLASNSFFLRPRLCYKNWFKVCTQLLNWILGGGNNASLKGMLLISRTLCTSRISLSSVQFLLLKLHRLD